jgi:hypothetical protein
MFSPGAAMFAATRPPCMMDAALQCLHEVYHRRLLFGLGRDNFAANSFRTFSEYVSTYLE